MAAPSSRNSSPLSDAASSPHGTPQMYPTSFSVPPPNGPLAGPSGSGSRSSLSNPDSTRGRDDRSDTSSTQHLDSQLSDLSEEGDDLHGLEDGDHHAGVKPATIPIAVKASQGGPNGDERIDEAAEWVLSLIYHEPDMMRRFGNGKLT